MDPQSAQNSQLDQACSICLEPLSTSVTWGGLLVTPCEHAFHRSCLWQWFRSGVPGKDCPLCKRELDVTDPIPMTLEEFATCQSTGEGPYATFIGQFDKPPRQRCRSSNSEPDFNLDNDFRPLFLPPLEMGPASAATARFLNRTGRSGQSFLPNYGGQPIVGDYRMYGRMMNGDLFGSGYRSEGRRSNNGQQQSRLNRDYNNRQGRNRSGQHFLHQIPFDRIHPRQQIQLELLPEQEYISLSFGMLAI